MSAGLAARLSAVALAITVLASSATAAFVQSPPPASPRPPTSATFFDAG